MTNTEAIELATLLHGMAGEVLLSIKRNKLDGVREAVEDLRYSVWKLEDYLIDASRTQVQTSNFFPNV